MNLDQTEKFSVSGPIVHRLTFRASAFTLKESTPEEEPLLSRRHAHNFRMD